MTSKRARNTSRSVAASRRSKRTKTQAEETNNKPESPGYLDVLVDQAGAIAENEAASSQKQQDDALEAKEASEVDEDDSSQEQTESGHASKGNKDGEDDEDGEGNNEDEEDDEDREGDNEDEKGDNEDGEDENNDDDDTDEKIITANDKTEEENNENVCSTPAEASSSGRDPSTTSTEIVVKNIRSRLDSSLASSAPLRINYAFDDRST
ncbi:hypothetical protein HAX54_030492 [Datura stramonium]|uniref:Uncharacterized protein n=1 Tax=Datura stramonium TaxID=4076 RepID=A0ABS8V8F9_DATST|nr:hypothetical protein [Datura stramonium]